MIGKWLVFGLGGIVALWLLGNYIKAHGALDLLVGSFVTVSIFVLCYVGYVVLRSGSYG